MRYLALFAAFLSFVPPAHSQPASKAADWREPFIRALKNGGAYVEDSSGRVLLSHRSQDHFVPASIIKVATSAAALEFFGRDYRFPTDFLLTKSNQLIVKGYGDPFLVSEELGRIAGALHEKGVFKVTDILLDTSYFSHGIAIDGVSQSPNPYDAVNGALIVNFNTIHVRVLKNNQVESAERQTPLTPIALAAAKGLRGTQRINIGGDSQKGALYAGELLKAFLTREGIEISGGIRLAETPSGAKPIYRHRSSKQLGEMVKDLLEYSTNFAANQIFLILGAEKYGAPATLEKSQRALTGFLEEEVGWRDFQVVEGAGLSRQNRVTPRQMISLLHWFEPYRDLLPVHENVIQAKTGTLRGVNTLAGFFPDADGRPVRFALMVNDQVPFDYKFKMAKLLFSGMNGKSQSK